MEESTIIDVQSLDRIRGALETSRMERGYLNYDGNLDTKDLQLLYTFFRKSMLDGHIPVIKPIGYKITNSTNGISRNNALLESQVEIIKNLSKLIIVDECAPEITATAVGRIRAGNLNIISDGKPVKFLDPSLYLCSSNKTIDISFIVDEQVGYRIMDENFKAIQDILLEYENKVINYFPLHTSSDLIDYIRILPFNYSKIKYTLQGNISEKDFNKIWKRYVVRVLNGERKVVAHA